MFVQLTKNSAKDSLSLKNGAHATVRLASGEKYTGEWKNNTRHGIFKTNKRTWSMHF
jgi:hypothetical protein